ncbi:MAG: hypothetical protein JJU36_13005 [Phycisphaeraceae bacterium]|nr:hypothetical protein [Phycisphaeraceae bacterium]
MDALTGNGRPRYPRFVDPCGVQIGGIGTGRVEMLPDGRFGIVQLGHSPQHLLSGYRGCFAWLRWDEELRVLERSAVSARPVRGCEAIDFRGRHPVARLGYAMSDIAARVELTAFSPLVPHDAARSAIPGVVLRFSVRNLEPRRRRLELGLSWENMLGCGGIGPKGEALRLDRTGNIMEPWRGGRFKGVAMSRKTGDEAGGGRMVLACEAAEGLAVDAFCFWNALVDEPAVWEALQRGARPDRFDAGAVDAMLERWDEKRKAGPPSWDDPDPRYGGGRTGIEGYVHPAALVAASCELAPDELRELVFILAWHHPEHRTENQPGIDHGRFYEERFADPAEVVEYLGDRHATELEATEALARSLEGADLPDWLCDRLINDLTALTANQYITRDGTLWTLEASPQMWGSLGTLDQRLVSHISTSLFYPQLNRTELEVFARLQGDDGRLMHFSGNTHLALGAGKVGYGDTGWPDLSMSMIVQAYRDWSESGDDAVAARWEPTVLRAFDWLVSRDADGDGVPEGGSSWDIEHYGGCFIPTATLWLATLGVMAAWHDERGRGSEAEAARKMLERAQRTVEGMWLGEYYAKVLDPATGDMSDDCFIGQLEGRWVCDQLGLPPVLGRERSIQAARAIMKRNGDAGRYRLPPIQVCADGTLPDRKYAWHSWPPYATTFLHAASIYLGLGDEAMEQAAAMDRTLSGLLGDPWASTIWYDCRTGLPDFGFYGRDWYMSSPATWWLLGALTGIAERAHVGQLVIGPWLPAGEVRRRYPVYTSRWWGVMDVEGQGGQRRIELSVARRFDQGAIELRSIRLRGRSSDATLEVDGHAVDSWRSPRDEYTDIELATPCAGNWARLGLEYTLDNSD